jgi:hypothetical protein
LTADRARALTGWTAGAHVPAVQLSSLPLDEWHYMRTNEMGLGPVATSTRTNTLVELRWLDPAQLDALMPDLFPAVRAHLGVHRADPHR